MSRGHEVRCPVCDAPPYLSCRAADGRGVPYHPQRVLAVGPPPDHRPVCACGGEWPCADSLPEWRERRAKAARGELERRIERLEDGLCVACGYPLRATQRVCAPWSGANVWRPDLPSPAFHVRQDCLEGARVYDQAWAEAWPRTKRGGPGRVLRLSCGGTVTHHVDGSVSCTAERDGCWVRIAPRIGRNVPRSVIRHRTSVWCRPGSGCERCQLPHVRRLETVDLTPPIG